MNIQENITSLSDLTGLSPTDEPQKPHDILPPADTPPIQTPEETVPSPAEEHEKAPINEQQEEEEEEETGEGEETEEGRQRRSMGKREEEEEEDEVKPSGTPEELLSNEQNPSEPDHPSTPAALPNESKEGTPAEEDAAQATQRKVSYYT